jgi:hypothetical protein
MGKCGIGVGFDGRKIVNKFLLDSRCLVGFSVVAFLRKI